MEPRLLSTIDSVDSWLYRFGAEPNHEDVEIALRFWLRAFFTARETAQYQLANTYAGKIEKIGCILKDCQ